MKKSSKDAEKDYLKNYNYTASKERIVCLLEKYSIFRRVCLITVLGTNCKNGMIIKAGKLITRLRKENKRMKDFSRDLATGTFMQRYGAVDIWLKSNKIKRGI